jgi:cobalt-zinc-cadmium efflux system membrane fusion protein
MGDWCEQHGLPLSHCRECNPALEFTAPEEARDWCKEHGVPETMCTKCHPELVVKFITQGNYCREHGYPQSVCPRCNPQLVTARGESLPVFPDPRTKVRLASVETAREAGIQTVRIAQTRLSEQLHVVGRLDFNQNRLAHLSGRDKAVILEIQADVGDDVVPEQPLLVLASAAIGEEQSRLSAAKANLAAASATVERERALEAEGISSKKELQAAEAARAGARSEHEAALAALGAAGAEAGSRGGRYILRSPIAGTVVARDAVIGKAATAGQPLLQVADVTTMWAFLEVPEADAARVHPGQRVTLHVEGIARDFNEATVNRISSSVDPHTRTVRVRVDVPNPDRSLKAGSLVHASIHVSADRDAVVVPDDAIQYAEGQSIVFVQRDEGIYLPVSVQLGLSVAGHTEIVRGLTEGAEVVTTGAFLLKTEILKESIGAGCCETGGE